jgi:hypothetical protein
MVNAAATALEFGPMFTGAPTAVDLLGLADTPNTYSGANFASVTCTTSGVVFTTPSVTTTNSITGGGNPNDTSVFTAMKLVNDAATPGNNKYYATTSAGVKGWRSPALVGATDFPANYTSAGGKFLKVNSGATAVEFATVDIQGMLDAITDLTARVVALEAL